MLLTKHFRPWDEVQKQLFDTHSLKDFRLTWGVCHNRKNPSHIGLPVPGTIDDLFGWLASPTHSLAILIDLSRIGKNVSVRRVKKEASIKHESEDLAVETPSRASTVESEASLKTPECLRPYFRTQVKQEPSNAAPPASPAASMAPPALPTSLTPAPLTPPPAVFTQQSVVESPPTSRSPVRPHSSASPQRRRSARNVKKTAKAAR